MFLSKLSIQNAVGNNIKDVIRIGMIILREAFKLSSNKYFIEVFFSSNLYIPYIIIVKRHGIAK